MWALRRASNRLKNCSLRRGIASVHTAKSESPNSYVEEIIKSPSILTNSSPKRFFSSKECSSSQLFMAKCGFSSQAKDEDDLEDGFSELETPLSADANSEDSDNDNDNEPLSEPELSDIDDEVSPENDLDLIENEVNSGKKSTRAPSILFQAISANINLSVGNILDKWVEEGKELSSSDIWLAFLNLRRRKMFGKALQLSEWLEKDNNYELKERDYSSRVDLISKVQGLTKAEAYVEKIPASFRSEVVYRTLLANSIQENSSNKAQEIFNKMRDLGFPLSSFVCNQLLLLYKRTDKKKIADVLLLMEKENVKSTLFTYRILIDTKGQSNDLEGMEKVLEAMKADGIEPDIMTQASLAKHYTAGGEKEKAEAVLKEMESGDLEKHRSACQLLLRLYAEIGKAEEVRRVWKVCESRPRPDEFLAAIEAWGKLKEVGEAEAVFDQMSNTWKKLSAKQYSTLLKVYTDTKMLSKGKDLVRRMAGSGCKVGALTWDSIVKLYVASGEVEKADSILHNAAQKNKMKPMFTSFNTIMAQYAKSGDIHNTEKMFQRMRQAGYTARFKQFQCLLEAYAKANAPAYGMRERMKADGIFPSKVLAPLLYQVDPFKKTPMSDLLD